MSKKKEEIEAINQEMNNSDKYEEFVKWYSLPINEKVEEFGCKSETKFADKYNVNRVTLWKWKNKDDFKDSIKQIRFDWGKKHTPNVFAGWLNSCMKGNPFAIELWLAYFEQWDKKHVIQNQVPEFTNNDLLKLIEVLPKDKQQQFYDTVNNIIIAARNERDRKTIESTRAGEESTESKTGQTDQPTTDQNKAEPAIRLGTGYMATANRNKSEGNESGKTDNLPPVEKSSNEVAESPAESIRHNME